MARWNGGRPAVAGRWAGAAMPAVLMYHSVTARHHDPYLVTVTPERFARQMSWLRRRGLRGVSVRDLLAARRNDAGSGLVGLTFDDGYADFVEHAVPVLAQHGFGATVFPVAGLLGGTNDWDAEGPRRALMTACQVRQAADAGIEIGSHGMRHVSLPTADGPTLAAETESSRAVLQAASGQEVAGFCYPYGHVDGRAAAAARAAGYDYACAIWVSRHTGPHALPRIYIGEADSSWRLWAKSARHLLRRDHAGVGAGLAAGGRREADGENPSTGVGRLRRLADARRAADRHSRI